MPVACCVVSAGELPTPQRLSYLKELVQRVHQETLQLDMSQRGMDPKVGFDEQSAGTTAHL
jgi:hypothetical protein